MWTHIDSFHMGSFVSKLYIAEPYIRENGNDITFKIELFLGMERIKSKMWSKSKKVPFGFRLKSLDMLNQFLDKHKEMVRKLKFKIEEGSGKE